MRPCLIPPRAHRPSTRKSVDDKLLGMLFTHRFFGLLFLAASTLTAADSVTPGQFLVERPTLICLGFEWRIEGDDNRNSLVEVSYRKAEEQSWKQGMPLFRLGGEKVFRKDLGLDYTAPEMFAGSILDLEPDTEYEARFQMKDPDGVRGEGVHTVKV